MSALGNKEIMAKNIRYYMEINNLTQTEICQALNFKMPTFSDWVNAKTYPRIDKIEMMANYFGIKKSDLVESHDKKECQISAVRIPVVGCVRAGLPIDAIEEILDYEEITPELAASGEFFGLRVKGDSMEPKFSEGDVVIVRQQDDAECGDIVIALVNGNEATIKKLLKYESGGIALVASNPFYEPMQFTEQEILDKPVHIIGKVVELRAKF